MTEAKLMALELNDEEGRELLALLSGDEDQRAQAEAKVLNKVRNGEAVELGSGALRDTLRKMVGERPQPEPEKEEDDEDDGEGTDENVIDFDDIIKHFRRRAVESLKVELRQRFLNDVVRNVHYLLHEADGKLIDEAKTDIARALNLLCAATTALDNKALDYHVVRYLTHELDALNTLRAKASCEGSA